MFCMFSNVTADVRCEENQMEVLCTFWGKKSLKHQVINSVCFRAKCEPKGHDSVSFIRCDHQHIPLTQNNAEYSIKFYQLERVHGNNRLRKSKLPASVTSPKTWPASPQFTRRTVCKWSRLKKGVSIRGEQTQASRRRSFVMWKWRK